MNLEPGERSPRLEQLCAGDKSLRRELESLLQSDSRATGFMAGPPLTIPARLITDDEFCGRRLGAYQIVRELGRGGLGVVYLAERADEQFQKQVAIKLIKRGLDTDEIQRRFRRERQILASLDHPNIARLLDAGMTEDGLSYFVMELVEGEPILDYCSEHQLGVEKRLRLFCTVCDAVSYAHQHLVIHRDLKPSNIPVTPDGTVKLLDFGIAKMLAAGDEQLANTMPEERILTREYASPEQLHGERMTTASDVYSLGVVLHELLTGQKPQAGASSEIVRPSAVVVNDQKSLRGDLDNIILKALRQEPDRRYSSARLLADDIERHLGRLPIRARPDTFSYRAGKFLKRNRIVAMAALLIALAIIAALVVSMRETRIAQKQRDLARQEKIRAERINTFLAATLADAGPVLNRRLHLGEPNSLVEVLDTAASRLTAGEFANDPEARGDLERIIGTSYATQGKYALATQHLRQWISLARQIYPENHPKAVTAVADEAESLFFDGKLKDSEALFRKVLPSLRAEHSKGRIESALLASAVNIFAYLRRTQGDSVEAEQLFRESLGLMPPALLPFQRDLNATRSTLALTLADQGKFAEAVSTAREAVREQEQSHAKNSDVIAFALTVLGGLLTEQGDYHEADSCLRRAESIFRDLTDPASLWVGDNLRNQAAFFYAQGGYDEAIRKVDEALRIYRESFGTHYDNYPTALDIKGLALVKRGQLDDGEKLLREALLMRQQALPADHFWVALAKGALGECLSIEKCYSEAEPLLRESYESLRASQGTENPRTKMAQQRLVDLQRATDQSEWNSDF